MKARVARTGAQQLRPKLRRVKLEKALAEGYVANAFQARQTANEFSNVDSELSLRQRRDRHPKLGRER